MDKQITDRSILFYDGACGFCHKVIKISNKWLKNDNVKFATLQGKKATELKNKFHNFPKKIDSIVFYSFDQDKIYLAANGFFELAKNFKYPWKLFSFFRIIPGFISNFIYNMIASNRYKLFGKKDICELPNNRFKERFLDE
jgi:predicted DCC family thiol-disulfide oxidoreductase YuxK